MTKASSARRARSSGLADTRWYEVTMPCMSGARRPSAADHAGSRWSENADAARAHWSFRCAVGATTTSREGCCPRPCRAAVSANVVFPAPGVATARKSFASDAAKRSKAAFCHGLRRTIRVMDPRRPADDTARTCRPSRCQTLRVRAITDGGLETTLIYHHGATLPDFAAFVLLEDETGLESLRRYYGPYIEIARRERVRAILDTPTWRANTDWGARLGYDAAALAGVNRRAVALLDAIRSESPGV